mmetsp:Transcript_24832/g.68774  ORF Transcript_24832/g.68774 Transcript_24832/m.68774 type:complete len:201 (+) Transcript_24832:996-1598(+)
MVSSTDCGAEQHRVFRETKHVSMNQFPTRLLFFKRIVVKFHVSRKIVLEDSQQDDSEERSQKQNQNERVDDGKPVNFKGGRDKVRVGVSCQTVLPQKIWLSVEFDRVRKCDGLGNFHIGDINTTVHVGCHFGGHNLVSVVSEVKVKMRKEVSFAAFHLTNDKIFIGNISNVTPHGQILHKHFEKVIVVNGVLELLQLDLS